MKQIEITLGTDGQITIEGQRFVGPDCEKATAFLEQALGRVTERKRKPEYHQKAAWWAVQALNLRPHPCEGYDGRRPDFAGLLEDFAVPCSHPSA